MALAQWVFLLCLFSELFAYSSALTKHQTSLMKHQTFKSRSSGTLMHTSDDYEVIEVPTSTGARCLDGSSYYFTYYPGDSDHWTIAFDSGGLGCFTLDGDDEQDNCELRSQTDSGSSKNTNSTPCVCRNYNDEGQAVNTCHCVGILDCDASLNLGYNEAPFGPSGNLYSRGRYNLEATLDILLESYGLADASHVLVKGGSAAGVAAFLALDYINLKVTLAAGGGPTLSDGGPAFRGYHIGSFIIEHEEAKDEGGYIWNVEQFYNYHDVSSQLSADCQDAHPDEPWLCMLGVHAISYVETPMFFMNSMYDSWQLVSLGGMDYTAIYDEYAGVKDLKTDVEAYGAEWKEAFETVMSEDSQNSAYVSSCVCHVDCGDEWFLDSVLKQYADWYTNTPHDTVYAETTEPNYYCQDTIGAEDGKP